MEKTRPSKLLDDFWRALLAFATLIGAYFGAAALDIEWAFWIAAPAAGVFAISRWVYPVAKIKYHQIKSLITNGREYPQLQKIAATYQAEVEDLERDVEQLRDTLEIRYSEGVLAGRKRLLGEYYAGLCSAKLTPRIMAIVENERLVSCAANSLAKS